MLGPIASPGISVEPRPGSGRTLACVLSEFMGYCLMSMGPSRTTTVGSFQSRF